MKILIHDYAGHAFPIQLSRQLARRGHRILHLYAGYNQTPRGELQPRADDPDTFDIRGVFIRRPLRKDALLQRWFQEREYGRCVVRQVREFRPDLVLSANTPLDAQGPILRETLRQGARFVFWLQDFIGIGASKILSRKVPLAGRLIGGHYQRLEKRLLHLSHAVVGISEDFRPILEDWGVDKERIHIIPNWAPIEMVPLMPKSNPWAMAHGLSDAFVFMYTGTLGMKHDPRVLLDLPRAIDAHDGDCKLVVVSEGPAVEWLRKQVGRSNGSKVLITDFQPVERYAQVLASANILVAILEKEAGVFSVPSKVLSYLCAGRPVLASLPSENLAARIIRENHAGIVVDPHENGEFLQAAARLIRDPALREEMGVNARDYAERKFNIHRITDRFEDLIDRLN